MVSKKLLMTCLLILTVGISGCKTTDKKNEGPFVWPDLCTEEEPFINSQLKTFRMKDGSKVTAYLQNGRYSSCRIVQFTDGRKLEGTIVNNKPRGFGRLTMRNGDYTVGWFKQGFINGKGKYVSPGKYQYFGEFKNSTIEGKGILTDYRDGSVMEGHFAAGVPAGSGKQTLKDGTIYTGNFLGGRWHGKGLLKISNGEIYDGGFFQGKFHGKGTYTFKNGDSYIGTFKHGKFGREGVYSFHSGAQYRGQFSSRAMHGLGEMVFQDGSSYKGGFSLNKPSGTATYNNGSAEEVQINCENGTFFILNESFSEDDKIEIRQELNAQFAIINM